MLVLDLPNLQALIKSSEQDNGCKQLIGIQIGALLPKKNCRDDPPSAL